MHPIVEVSDQKSQFENLKRLAKFTQCRVLVADDEEFCIASMRAILQLAGLDVENQVDFCITGKEAFEQVKYAYSNGFSYKVILTDFSMPIMDGIDATAKIRAFLTTEMAIPLEE